jgi:glycosyltransferase involved in cell wall biosynthesis
MVILLDAIIRYPKNGDMVINLQQKSDRSSNIATNPLVSVIIDNYNYGHFLEQAIDSVLEQTYKNFELIVVDDGSIDNSREVIKSYEDRLIAIFQKNAGQRAAFIAGLEKAKGEIICFLDSDDYFHKDKLSKVVAAFLEHPEWVQISHCWIVVNAEGLPTGSNTSNLLSKGDVRSLLLRWGKYASGITSSLAVRHTIFEKVKLTPGEFGIDSYLIASIPFHGEVGCINEPLMFYRTHGKNFRAYSDNIPRLLKEHETIANSINQAAAYTGLTERFDIRRDVDYRAYKAIQRGGIPWTEAIEIIWLSLQESIALGRSPKDALIRLLTRAICAFFPTQGILVLRYGLRGYLRCKFLGEPKR